MAASVHEDRKTRRGADRRAQSWARLLKGMTHGEVARGSLTSIKALPGWVTLEIERPKTELWTTTQQTGKTIAGGPLEADEIERALALGIRPNRAEVFASYLTGTGLRELYELLDQGSYRVHRPEEAALLVIAWLLREKDRTNALDILEQITPYAARLRFMPRVASARYLPPGVVARHTTGDIIAFLDGIGTSERIETQREALCVWLPLRDEFLALWLSLRTATGDDLTSSEATSKTLSWSAEQVEEAHRVLRRYDAALRQHPRCNKPHHEGSNLRLLVDATRKRLLNQLDPSSFGWARWQRVT